MPRDKIYYQKLYDMKAWQGFHVNQLSYFRNIILVLSTAVLGFSVNLLSTRNYFCCMDFVIKTSCVLLIISIVIGICLALLESRNYRLKYKIGRMIESKDDFNELPNDIQVQINSCSKIEKINRTLIIIEMILFVVAIIMLTLTFFNYQ